ncbi:hypothetical protein [Desulfurococcus mucosus]|uniref:DUF2029 domain-containing protein n=1 Tax=Desulfurococcus mucosus (strain ATCC 35584 / DSM 2162 / JCM 9187 / O7/1) TaxID=765177 RepID=E8R7D3_DESM0|nr:hypothetical protein [Desulfurococcus mucosus]ADV65598.1 hypothetical protein Desmu_1304 [Desulfurococcus mucosus DSM 2162]
MSPRMHPSTSTATAPRAVLAVTVILLAASIVVHMPTEVQKTLLGRVILHDPVYDDLYASVKQVFYVDSCNPGSGVWLDKAAASTLCSGGRALVFPYLDYRLNQPPLAGFILASMTSLSMLSPGGPEVFLSVFYLLQSILSTAAALYSVYRLTTRGGVYFYPLYAATLLVYGVYGFDVFALPFIVEAFIAIREGRWRRAAFSTALALSVSFYMLIPLGLLAYMVVRGDLDERGVVAGLLSGVPLFIAVVAMDPGYFNNVIGDVLQPVFNNGVFSILTLKASVGAAYAFNTGVWILGMLILYSMSPPAGSRMDLLRHMAASMLLLYAVHPRMVPQTLLLVLPLLLSFIKPADPGMLVVEASNAAIILLWFKAGEASRYLSAILGVEAPPQPTSLGNPVQWIALFRGALTLLYALSLLTQPLGEESEKKLLWRG